MSEFTQLLNHQGTLQTRRCGPGWEGRPQGRILLSCTPKLPSPHSLEGSSELGGQGVEPAHLWHCWLLEPRLAIGQTCPLRALPVDQVSGISLGFLLEAGRSWSCCPVPSSSSVCAAGPAEPPGASEPGDGPPAEAGVPGGLAAARGPDTAAVPRGEWGLRPSPPSHGGPDPELSCRGARVRDSQEESSSQESRRPDPPFLWGPVRQAGQGEGRPCLLSEAVQSCPRAQKDLLPPPFRSWPRSTRRPCSCCGSSRPSFWMTN